MWVNVCRCLVTLIHCTSYSCNLIMSRRRTMVPSGEKSKIKSIMRNCLHSLISCGTQSACAFSIINKHFADFSLFFLASWCWGFVFQLLECQKMVGGSLMWKPNFIPQVFYKLKQRKLCTHSLRGSEASLTLTSMCGKGPLEFSGTLIGGMTQSRFCLLSPLAAEAL